MKVLLCIALGLGCSVFSVQSGEIVKRQVQYGKSDTISTQYVFQSDRRKSKSRSRTSRTCRPTRSRGYSYYHAPVRSHCYSGYRPYTSYRPYTGPSSFRIGCTTIRITRGR